MSDDLKIVRRNMQERLRESGVSKRAAEQMAEQSVRRVAERKNRDQLDGRKPRG
jgi:hypothetical protein